MMHGEGVSVLLWGRTLDLWGRRPQLEDLGLQGYPRASASGTGSGGWAWGLCGWARGVQGWQGPWGTVSRLPHVQQAWCPLSFTRAAAQASASRAPCLPVRLSFRASCCGGGRGVGAPDIQWALNECSSRYFLGG